VIIADNANANLIRHNCARLPRGPSGSIGLREIKARSSQAEHKLIHGNGIVMNNNRTTSRAFGAAGG
jgi:hypothetical protein